jgi:hypothetical protein
MKLLEHKLNRQMIGAILFLLLFLFIVSLPNVSTPILSVIGAWYVGTLIAKGWQKFCN